MIKRLRVLFLFIGINFPVLLISQAGIIRGYVYEKESGDPVPFASVYLAGTTIGTNTDDEGFFVFTGVQPGDYTLVAKYVGFDSVGVEVKLVPRGIVNQNLYLQEGGVQLGAIDVTASRQFARTEVRMSQISVTPKQIKALPSIGGDADILQYLQVLPGIISTGDQGGQIFIRGGAPVQNKILLDGLNIYNPFHSIGFYSVFETELIRRVDVLTGGFGAEYGGRISAIVDIKTRDANRTTKSGQVSVSPFMGKFLLEGPITKYEEGKGSTSLVLTGKRSFIDRTSKSLYSYAAQNDSIGLPFEFTDLYGKLTINNANGSKVNIFGFNFRDGYNNPEVANLGWTNSGLGLNFNLIPPTSDLIITGAAGYSRYEVAINEAGLDNRKSAIAEFGANIDFTFFGNNNEISYGVDLRSIRTEFDFLNPFGLRLFEIQNSTEASGYFKIRQVLANLVVEPSVRAIYYAAQGTFSLEPRIGTKYNFSDNLRFKLAAGFYTQNVMSTSNERDVVNLFFGFLTGPESRILGFDNQLLENRLQKSRHLVGGFEYDLTKRIQINVEGYYKDFPQLIVVNRNKTTPQEPNYALETGKAYGLDFSIKYESPSWYIWSTYSYGFVRRFDGEQTFPVVFDRRHNINFLVTHSLDKSGDFQISARWNFGSGFPFTKTTGFYHQVNFTKGVNTDVLTSNPDKIGVLYSSVRNGGRLPYYHRLDISVNKKIHFSKNTGMELVASVTNVYDRQNIFYFNRIEYRRVNQLPIIPSLGVKFFF